MEHFNYKEKAIAVIVYCKNHCQVRFEIVIDFQKQITLLKTLADKSSVLTFQEINVTFLLVIY